MTSFWHTLMHTSPRSMASLSRHIASTDAAERPGLLLYSVVTTKITSSLFRGEMGGSAEFVARIHIFLNWVGGFRAPI